MDIYESVARFRVGLLPFAMVPFLCLGRILVLVEDLLVGTVRSEVSGFPASEAETFLHKSPLVFEVETLNLNGQSVHVHCVRVTLV